MDLLRNVGVRNCLQACNKKEKKSKKKEQEDHKKILDKFKSDEGRELYEQLDEIFKGKSANKKAQA